MRGSLLQRRLLSEVEDEYGKGSFFTVLKRLPTKQDIRDIKMHTLQEDAYFRQVARLARHAQTSQASGVMSLSVRDLNVHNLKNEFDALFNEYIAISTRIDDQKRNKYVLNDEEDRKEVVTQSLVKLIYDQYTNEQERMDAIVELLSDERTDIDRLEGQRRKSHMPDNIVTDDSSSILLIEGELTAYQSLHGWSAFTVQ
jgi:hypothetical protein